MSDTVDICGEEYRIGETYGPRGHRKKLLSLRPGFVYWADDTGKEYRCDFRFWPILAGFSVDGVEAMSNSDSELDDTPWSMFPHDSIDAWAWYIDQNFGDWHWRLERLEDGTFQAVMLSPDGAIDELGVDKTPAMALRRAMVSAKLAVDNSC